MYKFVLVLTFIVAKCHSSEVDVYENCGDSITCAEGNLVKLVDDFDAENSVPILGDYLILERTSQIAPKSSEGLFERLERFLASHEVKIRLPSSSSGRSLVEESRKKKKLRRLLLPILLLLKLKALVIIPAVLFSIALVAYKGFGAGVMALIISSGVALKSLLEKHHHSSTLSYEIVPQLPTAHWNRNGADAWTGLVPEYQTVP